MPKLPAFLHYTGDWMKDPQLSACSPATRGIWFDLINAMHELERSGQVTGTPAQLARLGRCTAGEMSAAIDELRQTGTANVSKRGDAFTIENRRMRREFLDRESARERKRRQRGNSENVPDVTLGHKKSREPQHNGDEGDSPLSRGSPENVTALSSSSSSSSVSNSHPPTSGESGKRAPGLPVGLTDHPVIWAYWQQFRVENIPAIGAQERAIASVLDLGLWQIVLDYWRDNQYRPESLGKMVDCYLEGGPRRKSDGGNGNGKPAGGSASQRNATKRIETERLLRRK